MIDQNIKEAIDAWINHGLEPGSCTTLLLQGRYDEAFLHAHPLIKPHWNDHVEYVKSIPEKYRGDNMQAHKESFRSNGREYRKYEFCKAVSCECMLPVSESQGIKGGCYFKHDGDCIHTAKELHHWLNENGFKIIKGII